MLSKERLTYLVLFLLAVFLTLLILNQLGLLKMLCSLFSQCSFLFMALLLVFIFEPVIEFIPWFSRPVRCSIVYFSLMILIAVFFILVAPALYSELSQIPSALDPILHEPAFQSAVQQLGKLNLSRGYEAALASTLSALQGLSSFALSYLAAYFISLDLESLMKVLLRRFQRLQELNNFYATCRNAVFHYLKGLFLDLLFLFCFEALVLFLFRFAHPLIFALLIAFLNLIPYIGATIGEILILAVDFINVGQLRFELFALCFLIQQIEANFIQPFIFSKVLDVRPIVTLIAIIVFGFLFGFAGFILAPVLAVILQLAYRSLVFTKRQKTVGTWENVWYNFDEIDDEDK